MMNIRLAEEKDYLELANMKWEHCKEDDIDYNENNLIGVDKEKFVKQYVEFFKESTEYRIFIAEVDGVIASSMFVYMIPKIPKPNGNAKFIAYLTNVYTKKEFRSEGIGSKLLKSIKDYMIDKKCELIFAWASTNSVNWYCRNDFYNEKELLQCDLIGE